MPELLHLRSEVPQEAPPMKNTTSVMQHQSTTDSSTLRPPVHDEEHLLFSCRLKYQFLRSQTSDIRSSSSLLQSHS